MLCCCVSIRLGFRVTIVLPSGNPKPYPKPEAREHCKQGATQVLDQQAGECASVQKV